MLNVTFENIAHVSRQNTATSRYITCYHCQCGSSMSLKKVLDDCITRQSFADWQEALFTGQLERKKARLRLSLPTRLEP